MSTEKMSNEDYARHMREKRGAGIGKSDTDWEFAHLDNILSRAVLRNRDDVAHRLPNIKNMEDLEASWSIRVGVPRDHAWWMQSAKSVGLEGYVVVHTHEDRRWFMKAEVCTRRKAERIAISIGTMAEDAIPRASSEGIATRAIA